MNKTGRYSDKEILTAVKTVAKDLENNAFTGSMYNEYRTNHPEQDLPHNVIIKERFGRLHNAQKEAGLEPKRYKYTEDEMYTAVLFAATELGKERGVDYRKTTFKTYDYEHFKRTHPEFIIPGTLAIIQRPGWNQIKKDLGLKISKGRYHR